MTIPTGKFCYQTSGEIDWGHDYYAPQSFLAPDGRRLIVGWANEWEWMSYWKDWGPTYKEGWCGFFQYSKGGQAYGRWHASVPSDRRNQIHQGGCLQGGCLASGAGKGI
ncbi:MAG: hypothetical protein ACLTLQ_04190 [[Clostridium] scindens]